MGRFNNVGEDLDLAFGQTLNENFSKADEALTENKTDITQHKTSTQAHAADAITYTGNVPAASVKEAIDKTDARISTIVAQAGDSNTEIVDARGGAPVLGDRLNGIDAQLADTEQKVDHLTVSKADKFLVDALEIQKANKEYVESQLNDIGISQINKNKGLFDETYFSESVKQQWAGNTPVSAVPADNSLVTKQYVDKSVTLPKLQNGLTDNYKLLRDIVFETGAISDTTGVSENNPDRLRFKDIELIKKGTTISVDDRFKLIVYRYNANGTYIGHDPNGYVQQYEFENDEYVRIVIRQNNGMAFTVDKTVITRSFSMYSLDSMGEIKTALSNNTSFLASEFLRGNVDDASGQPKWYEPQNRFYSEKITRFDKNTILRIKDKSQIRIVLYWFDENGQYQNYTSITDSYHFDEVKYARIMIVTLIEQPQRDKAKFVQMLEYVPDVAPDMIGNRSLMQTKLFSSDSNFDLQADWIMESGAINDNTGASEANPSRIRFKHIELFKSGTTLRIQDDYKLIVYSYDANGVYKGYLAGGYVQSITFETDTYGRVVIRQNDSNAPYNGNELQISQTLKAYSFDVLSVLRRDTDIKSYFLPTDFTRGSIRDNTGEGWWFGMSFRFHTKKVHEIKKGTLLKIADPTKFRSVLYFFNMVNGQLQYSHYETAPLSYIFNNDSYVRIMVVSLNDVEVRNMEVVSSNILINSGSSSSDLIQKLPQSTVRGTAHRGYSIGAPENTLPAYALAKKKGFIDVEADISFTADNIPVLCHNNQISHTSNGEGLISQMTLAQLKQYDFGSWFSPDFAGTQIPTLEEFLIFCKRHGLMPELDLKDHYTRDQIKIMVEIVIKTGMRFNTSWATGSGRENNLYIVKEFDETATLSLGSELSPTLINHCINLRNGKNIVYANVIYTSLTNALVQSVFENRLLLSTWTVNDPATVVQVAALGASRILTDGLDIDAILNGDLDVT